MKICYGCRFLLIVYFIGGVLAGCDSTEPTLEEPEIIEDPEMMPVDSVMLVTETDAELTVNNFHLRMDSSGVLHSGYWYPGGDLSIGNRIGVIFNAGINVAGYQQGEIRANTFIQPVSNYWVMQGNERLGVFLLNPGEIMQPATNWPAAQGAPTDDAGNPRVYGDQMAFSVLLPDTAEKSSFTERYASPFSNLTMTQMLYGYHNADLEDVLFIRYTFSNTGGEPLTGLYAGLYSDTDLEGFSSSSVSAGNNATAYDMERGLTYTYPYPAQGDSVFANQKVPVTGFIFLETPLAVPIAQSIASHPMLWKHKPSTSFSQIDITTPQKIYYVLQGLSSDGEPVINPVTGEVTTYAFTGDPVTETGWLHNSEDVRSLLSTGPFDLAPGETKTVTVLWGVAQGNVLSDALNSLKEKVDLVRNQSSLWEF